MPAGLTSLTLPLPPRSTFERFVGGPEHELVLRAARAVAERPGGAYNPFFLYGASGTGKTHLLQAIGHLVRTRRPGFDVQYVSAFSLGVSDAGQTSAAQHIMALAALAGADLLLLDDLQALAGQPAQAALARVVEQLLAGERQVVFAADRAPRALDGLDARLQRHCLSGLALEVAPPSLETRTALLRARAEARGVVVPTSVLTFLAQRTAGSTRELEQTLMQVLAAAELSGLPLTVDGAAALLSSRRATSGQSRPQPEQVLAAVSHAFGVAVEALQGKRREKDVVLPRQVAMYLMRQETGASLAEIGAHLGGRDHSTVLHGCAKIETLLPSDVRLQAHLATARHHLAELCRARTPPTLAQAGTGTGPVARPVPDAAPAAPRGSLDSSAAAP